jgi:hypothetical protein
MSHRLGSSLAPRRPHPPAFAAPAAPRVADTAQMRADTEPVIDGNADGADRHLMAGHRGEPNV